LVCGSFNNSKRYVDEVMGWLLDLLEKELEKIKEPQKKNSIREK